METMSAEQEVARNSNVLYDPSLVTQPQQIMPYLRAFFTHYSPAKRAQYDEFVQTRNVSKMAAKLEVFRQNSTEPILVNGEYYKVWDETSQKIKDWFKLNGEVDDTTGVSFKTVQQLASWDAFYNNLNNELINIRGRIVDNLSQQDVALHEMRIAEMGTITTELGARRTERMAQRNADLATLADLKSKYGIGERMPIGAPPEPTPPPAGIVNTMSEIAPGVEKLGFVTPNITPAKTTEKAAAEKYDALRLTGDGRDNYDRIIKYYEDLIARVGNYMLALFKATSFPAVITIREPAFVEKWEQIIDSAYDQFMLMAAQRSKASRNPRERQLRWNEYALDANFMVNNDDVRSFFAEFIGFRLTMFPLLKVPDAQVNRPNKMVDDSAHLTSLKFFNLYNVILNIVLRGLVPMKPVVVVGPLPKRAKIIGASFAINGNGEDAGDDIRVEFM